MRSTPDWAENNFSVRSAASAGTSNATFGALAANVGKTPMAATARVRQAQREARRRHRNKPEEIILSETHDRQFATSENRMADIFVVLKSESLFPRTFARTSG